MSLALTEAGRRIIDAVIEAPVAWRSPGELAERLGWGLDRTLDEIATLDAAGWLEAWELVDGPVVTLSVAATADCGVRLVEVGHDETPKWARPGDPDPPHQRAVGVFRSEKAAALDLVADARPDAEATAILAEEAEQLAHAGRPGWPERWPRPTLFIGGSLSPWPGPHQADDRDCPACRLAHLPAQAYCLRCDRWGLDLPVKAQGTHPGKARRAGLRHPHSLGELGKHESERRKRRKKRKERRAAQVNRLKPAAVRNPPRRLDPAPVRLAMT